MSNGKITTRLFLEKKMYKRYWHHDNCQATEDSISPLVTQSFEHLRGKQWKNSPIQIPWSKREDDGSKSIYPEFGKIYIYSLGFDQLKQMMHMAHNWREILKKSAYFKSKKPYRS
jgi:hypothetical protein